VHNPAAVQLPGATVTRRIDDAGDAAVEVYAPEETADEDEAAFLARVLRTTTRAVEKAKTLRIATVRIAADRPIALSISSDWHLDTTGATDVAGLLDHADAIRETPGAYACVIGDLGNNAIKHRGGGGPASIPDELRLLDLAVGRFGRKMLWVTSGNHDDWSIAFAGVDNLRSLAARRRIHYAPDELVVLVEIVDPADPETVTARWVIATRHQYRRHSGLNHTHACWRWLEEGSASGHWPTDTEGRTLLPDVLAIGHNHVAAVECRSTPRGSIWALRMGSWQHSSSYSRAVGFQSTAPTAPTVILAPTRAVDPLAFADYRVALEYLRTGSAPATDAAA
ncbi:MAG: hypothetical protein ACYC1Z_14910, partial [Georgenia sp.]